MRSSYRPNCASCSSVCPSVCLSVLAEVSSPAKLQARFSQWGGEGMARSHRKKDLKVNADKVETVVCELRRQQSFHKSLIEMERL